jgi:hypothetical protein
LARDERYPKRFEYGKYQETVLPNLNKVKTRQTVKLTYSVRQLHKNHRKIFLLSPPNIEIPSVYSDAEKGYPARASEARKD